MATAAGQFLLDQFGREVRAEASFYPGIASGRERRSMPAIIGDSNRTQTPLARLTTLGLARHLVANHGFIRGPVKDMTTYSVGTGLVPQSAVEDVKVARLLEDYFGYWGEQADYAGEHDFNTLQALASFAIDVDGDVGLHMYAPRARDLGQLQLIEGHRIGNAPGVGPGNGWVDGVKIDAYGRRLAYSIREGEFGDLLSRGSKDSYREVSRGEFIFLFDPDRADATRGISSLAHAIGDGRDIIDILGYEKVGVKMASAIGVAIKTHSGSADAGSSYVENGFAAKDTGGLPQETWQAGMVPRLKVGEEIDAFASNRPSPAFMGFLAFLIRNIAVGLGLPYEFVWDLVLAKGSGSRFILAKAQRRFEQRQALLKRRFLQRVWRWVIAKGIARKELPAAPWWWLVNWQAPAKITVDLGREAQANRDDLRYGNRTLQEDAGERGLHWKDDVREQRDLEVDDLIERAIAKVEKYKAYNLSLDKALFLMSGDSPNAPPSQQVAVGPAGTLDAE